MSVAFQPPARIGMLGGGQLGRMFAVEARAAGYTVVIWTDEAAGSPGGQWADVEINAPYDDEEAFDRFIRQVDVVTVEFENLPRELLEKVEREKPLRPGSRAVTICQNRELEKEFLRANGFPTVPFAIVRGSAELAEAIGRMGAPCVLKTADFGYDGRGQVKISSVSEQEAGEAWAKLDAPKGVLEGWAPYVKELSVIVARSLSGATAAFPVCENEHRNHILDLTVVPGRIPEEIGVRAREMAARVAEKLDYTGLITVEFFLLADGTLLINEMAPRPHNSGHFSIDACPVSQFAQQLRTVTGFEPAPGAIHCPSAMVNLLGDVWKSEWQAPDWTPLLSEPAAHLHLYGKAVARKGRKMGHFTVLGQSSEEVRSLALSLRGLLEGGEE